MPMPIHIGSDERPHTASLGSFAVHVWIVDLTGTGTRENPQPASDEGRPAGGDSSDIADRRASKAIADEWLYRLLGAYTGTPASQIRLKTDKWGKPGLRRRLRDVLRGTRLHFNVSRTARFAAFAFSRKTRVGIDIERIRPIETLPIAEREFCKQCLETLAGLHGADRLLQFYRYWTRKEAVLKYHGVGLAHEHRLYDSSRENCCRRCSGICEPDDGLLDLPLRPDRDLIGAVAAPSARRNTRVFEILGTDFAIDSASSGDPIVTALE